MQIKLLGFERQWTLKGNVVNVDSNLDMCVKSLPRQYQETSVVELKLMRKMDFKRPYIYDNIRPAKVLEAVRYLINTPLYTEDGVTLSDNWDSSVNLGIILHI